MNIPTIVVLVVIGVLLALAVRAMVRGSKKGKCAGCSQEGCGGAGTTDVCPATQRALADLEARLGPVDKDAKDGKP